MKVNSISNMEVAESHPCDDLTMAVFLKPGKRLYRVKIRLRLMESITYESETCISHEGRKVLRFLTALIESG